MARFFGGRPVSIGDPATPLATVNGIRVDLRSLNVRQDRIPVTTMTEADPDWRFVDRAGHEHYAVEEETSSVTLPRVVYPTLYRRTVTRTSRDPAYDFDEFEDEFDEDDSWDETIYVCMRCEQEIQPGSRPGRPRHVAGLRSITAEIMCPAEVACNIDERANPRVEIELPGSETKRYEAYATMVRSMGPHDWVEMTMELREVDKPRPVPGYPVRSISGGSIEYERTPFWQDMVDAASPAREDNYGLTNQLPDDLDDWLPTLPE